MRLLLVLLLSGFAGTLLGWLASRLAVYLVFHPSRPIIFLGRRLPLTPGLWLRGREKLAGHVADLFAKDFATGKVLREGLREAKSLSRLEAGISARLSQAVEGPIGLLLAAPGPSSGSPTGRIEEGRTGLAGDLARRLLENPALARAFDRALGEALSLVKDLPLSVLLPAERARAMAASFLSEESLRRLAERLEQWVQGRVRAGGSAKTGSAALPAIQTSPPVIESLVAGLIPAKSLSPIVGLFVDALYDAAIPLIESFLNDVDTRDLVEKGAKEMVRRAVSRLGTLQRLIAGAANYEGSIAETMPETIEDLVSMVSGILRSASMRAKVREAALDGWEAADEGRRGLPASLASSFSREALWKALALVLASLVEKGPGIADRVEVLVETGKDLTLSSLFAASGLGDFRMPGLADLGSLLGDNEEAARALAEAREVFVAALLDAVSASSVSEIFGLDEEAKRSISTWLASTSLALLDAEADSIVESFDIRSLVIEKLASMDNNEAKSAFGPILRGAGRVMALSLGGLGILAGLVDIAIIKMLGG